MLTQGVQLREEQTLRKCAIQKGDDKNPEVYAAFKTANSRFISQATIPLDGSLLTRSQW